MLDQIWRVLNVGVQKVKEIKYALAFAAIAAAIALAASILRGYMSNVAGVVVAVNMGVMLIVAVLMTIAAARAKGQHATSYARLYLVLAWIFSSILVVSAVFSLTSIFFHWPADFRETADVAPSFTGDYRIEETVILTDLRHRVPTKNLPGAVSKDIKYRLDRVVKQRLTPNPYELQWGTNGLGIENFESPTHPGLTTKEDASKIFTLTTKHTYISSIPADQIPFNYPSDVRVQAAFLNAFEGDSEEWVGACPNIDTVSLTMIVLFPANKPVKSVKGMEEPTGSSEIPFRGKTGPIIQDSGRILTWTIPNPTKGVGYFVDFTW